MADTQREKEENFLDRLAYFDGRLDALAYTQQQFERIMAAGGPPPAPSDPPHAILIYQVHIATECGRVMQEVGAELSKVMDAREQFLKDKAVDLDGQPVH